MKRWNSISVNVSYSPSDPGSDNWRCEPTRHSRDSVATGELPYNDISGLFGKITVSDISDEGLTLSYRNRKIRLTTYYSYADLDSGGRDYTRFELSVILALVDVEDNAGASSDDTDLQDCSDEEDGNCADCNNNGGAVNEGCSESLGDDSDEDDWAYDDDDEYDDGRYDAWA